MNSLLETLVAISKLEALETLSKDQIDISALTESIIHDVEKIYQQKHITLTTHLHKDIFKKAHTSCSIIIKNILDNAYKFTPE